MRIASLPVGDPGFEHFRIAAVVEPHLLQIQPALEDVFVGVDHQRLRLFRRHSGKRLPGGVDIFLLSIAAQQWLLRNQRAEQGQRRAALFGGDGRLPVACLLVVIQRFHVDISEDLFRRRVIFLRGFHFGRQQSLFAALGIVQFLRQLVVQIDRLLRFAFFQQ
ncbi:hypothetical protein D3C72_1045390 [compost metagenome]